MTSKRELEKRVRAKHDSMVRSFEKENAERNRADRLERALKRVAKHYGFHDAYVREERIIVERHLGYPPEHQTTGYRNVFSVDALIADLDAIDQERSADEARKRLGITKEEA